MAWRRPLYQLLTRNQPRRCLSTPRPQTIAQLLDWKPEVDTGDLVINGYVKSVRKVKTNQFVNVGDGSTQRHLQAVVSRDQSDGLRVGAAVRLTGSYVKSQGSGQDRELQVDKVDILGPSDAGTYPLQNKYQTAEYLRTLPHLRSRLPANAALLRLRSHAIVILTQFFANRGFVQTHPPIITSSDCEGAGEVFTVFAGDAIKTPASTPPSASAADKTSDSFFRAPKYLTVSSQLHLEALAQSVGDVWALSPTFRAERSDTSRHLSEFYMLEAEMPFIDDMAAVMDLTEDMLRDMVSCLYETDAAREILGSGGEEVARRWQGMASTAWPRITYTEAIDLLQPEAHRFEHKPVWGDGLQAEHEKFLASTLGVSGSAAGCYRPVFVTNYPRDIKAFYMRRSTSAGTAAASGPGSVPGVPAHGRAGDAEVAEADTVDCFDLLVPELCEIAGGSMREHRLGELLAAMGRRDMLRRSEIGADGLPARGAGGDLDWYVDLRRWGSPPHGGFGLGFDRLLGYLTGTVSVRDVVAFPRWYGRCDC